MCIPQEVPDHLAFASRVAKSSHSCTNISPSGSTTFTPLSCRDHVTGHVTSHMAMTHTWTGLCEAVIITPTLAAGEEREREREEKGGET